MLTTALLAYLAAFICYFVQWTFGQPMIDQPLGVGLVAGIIFGDVTAGIIIGAALQAIFIGSVNVGGATSADTVAGTVLAVCFVVVSGMEQGVAIPLAVAAAIFANIIYSLVLNVLMSFWAPVIDWAANSGDSKKLFICHFGGAVVMERSIRHPDVFGGVGRCRAGIAAYEYGAAGGPERVQCCIRPASRRGHGATSAHALG